MASTEAPAPLNVVQHFLNSADLEEAEEELTDPAALKGWLSERGLVDPGEGVQDSDVELAKEVREALRVLTLCNNECAIEDQATATLNRVAGRGRLVVSFGPDGEPELVSQGDGVERALVQMIGIAYTAMADGSWDRLKGCRRQSCKWVFYDNSKNRSRTWCSMKTCGNREKAHAYRERHRHDDEVVTSV